MKKVGKWWFPDHDTHFSAWFQEHRTDQYQEFVRTVALSHVKSFEYAVDVGANVGTWSVPLAERFQKVTAIEADDVNYRCLLRNTRRIDRIHTEHTAVSDQVGVTAWFRDPDNCGNQGMLTATPTEPTQEWMHTNTLDQVIQGAPTFIKIDVQGAELRVLQGAQQILKQHHPILCLESPRRTPQEKVQHRQLVQWLGQFQYQILDLVRKECIMG